MTANSSAPQKTTKQRRGNGAQRLAKACSRKLRDNDEEIAAALFRRAAEGNTGAMRLLLKVIEKHPFARIHKRRAASGKKALIAALAELQWVLPKPHQSRERQERNA